MPGRGAPAVLAEPDAPHSGEVALMAVGASAPLVSTLARAEGLLHSREENSVAALGELLCNRADDWHLSFDRSNSSEKRPLSMSCVSSSSSLCSRPSLAPSSTASASSSPSLPGVGSS